VNTENIDTLGISLVKTFFGGMRRAKGDRFGIKGAKIRRRGISGAKIIIRFCICRAKVKRMGI
jgi:hypothetical protein